MCYPDSGIGHIMNSPEFRKYLGVSEDKVGTWQECNMIVHYYLIDDYQKMFGYKLKDILN